METRRRAVAVRVQEVSAKTWVVFGVVWAALMLCALLFVAGATKKGNDR